MSLGTAVVEGEGKGEGGGGGEKKIVLGSSGGCTMCMTDDISKNGQN